MDIRKNKTDPDTKKRNMQQVL